MWIKTNPKKAAWAAGRRRSPVSATVSHDVTDLFHNISLHGYSKLVAPELTVWEKFLWLLVHVTTMSLLLVMLALSWEEYASRYIAINLHDPRYPVEKVPFPAVSICSSNRISRRAAIQYADSLSVKDPLNRSSEYFRQNIKAFAHFYHKYETNQNYESFENFQNFLDNYDTWNNKTVFYNTRDKMAGLTPKCEEFILQCLLAGKEIECFSTMTFQASLTTYGHCCTFNTEHSYRQRTVRNRFLSHELGLTVVLNSSRADNLVSLLNIDGYIVIVHDPDEYPDIASSKSQEVFPSHGKESFVAITPRIVDTDGELRTFQPKTRKCYFNDESPEDEPLLNNVYSFSNCITRCRMRSVLALCRCIPFFFPLDLLEKLDGVIYCTLQHVSCLLRYSYKWNNVLIERETIPGLEREVEEALYCPICLPSCVDVQYQLSLMSLPIVGFQSSLFLDERNLTVDNISLLRVHFDEAVIKYYRRVMGNSWYDALYTVGNISSIFLGFSIVAVFEILYFAVKNSIHKIRRFTKEKSSKGKHLAGEQNMDESKLYICP